MRELKIIFSWLCLTSGFLVLFLGVPMSYIYSGLARALVGGNLPSWVAAVLAGIPGLALIWVGLRLRRTV